MYLNRSFWCQSHLTLWKRQLTWSSTSALKTLKSSTANIVSDRDALQLISYRTFIGMWHQSILNELPFYTSEVMPYNKKLSVWMLLWTESLPKHTYYILVYYSHQLCLFCTQTIFRSANITNPLFNLADVSSLKSCFSSVRPLCVKESKFFLSTGT